MLSEAVVEAVAGSVGSVIALLFTYPLKTIYTFQALDARSSQTASKQKLGSVLDVLKMYGLKRLYVGIEPSIVDSFVSSAVYFYLYSQLRHIAVKLKSKTKVTGSSKHASLDIVSSLIVASLAAAGNQLITQPMGVISTRMQAKERKRPTTQSTTQPAHSIPVLSSDNTTGTTACSSHVPNTESHPLSSTVYNNVLFSTRSEKFTHDSLTDTLTNPLIPTPSIPLLPAPSPAPGSGAIPVIKEIYQESGLFGFWRGMGPALILVINPAIQFMVYEQLLTLVRTYKASDSSKASSLVGKARKLPTKLGSLEVFLTSALAKIVATVVTYPLIVVKSRLQAQGKPSIEESTCEPTYTSTADALTRIYQEESLAGFFKGLNAKVIQTALNAALGMMMKERLYVGTRALLVTK